MESGTAISAKARVASEIFATGRGLHHRFQSSITTAKGSANTRVAAASAHIRAEKEYRPIDCSRCDRKVSQSAAPNSGRKSVSLMVYEKIAIQDGTQQKTAQATSATSVSPVSSLTTRCHIHGVRIERAALWIQMAVAPPPVIQMAAP